MPQDEVVQQFIVDEFMPDVPVSELDVDMDLIENGVIDSLGLLKVIAWIESRFEVSVDAMEMVPENFSSVRAISAFLDRARQAENA